MRATSPSGLRREEIKVMAGVHAPPVKKNIGSSTPCKTVRSERLFSHKRVTRDEDGRQLVQQRGQPRVLRTTNRRDVQLYKL